MKKLFVLLFLGLISITSKAQTELPKAIQDINTLVNNINVEKGIPVKRIDNTFLRPATHYIWLIDNQISKIAVVQPLPHANSVAEFYFRYDRIVFAREGVVQDGKPTLNIEKQDYPISDTIFRNGYFDFNEMISQDYLVFEGKDTLFWGALIQAQGYALFDIYRTIQNFNPYKNLQYDSIVVYDFNGDGAGSITYNNTLNSTAKNGKKLSPQQTDSLLTTLTDTATYGAGTSLCFDPHMGIVFYKDKKIVSTLDVCFGCNYLISSTHLPAQSYHAKTDVYDDYVVRRFNNGFSLEGRKKLKQLCAALKLEYCPLKKEDSVWDDPTINR